MSKPAPVQVEQRLSYSETWPFWRWYGSQEWSQYLRANVLLRDTQELACHIHPSPLGDTGRVCHLPRKRTTGRHLVDFCPTMVWGNLFWHLSHQAQVEDCGLEWLNNPFIRITCILPWHLWYRTLLLMAWIVVYLLMEQPWTELSADTDLDTTDASFCTSPHSVQKGGSVRNGLSYHSVRSQWWRTESSARAWRRKNKLPSQSRRNSWLKHKCLRQSLQDEAESSSNGSGVGHRHAEHTSPTITNHALRYGHTLSPDRSTSKSSVSSSSAITVLMSALTSVLFCSVRWLLQ